MLKKCDNDGVEFEAKRSTARFCSDKCRVEAARAVGVNPETGEITTLHTDSPPITTRANRPIKAPAEPEASEPVADIDYASIDNPFDRIKDEPYDYEKNMAAFKKMGLDEVEWLSTGLPGFDALTKIPKGRLTQIEGRYSAGKTTLCLNLIMGMRDKKVLYVDTEASLNPVLLGALKVNHANFDLYNKSAYLEDVVPMLKEKIRSGKYDLVVLDSLAATTTKTIDDSDPTASNIGAKAKVFNKFLETIMGDLRDTKTALVIINQTRDKIGTYTPETYTPGGTGKDYNASLMISLKTIKSWRFGRTASDTKAKKFIGQEVEATIIKSKVNTPWRTAKFKLYYPQPREEAPNDTQF